MTAAFGLLVAALGRTEEQSRGLSILAVLAMVDARRRVVPHRS